MSSEDFLRDAARPDHRHRRASPATDRRRALRVRPHRPAPGPTDDREPWRPERAPAPRHRRPQGGPDDLVKRASLLRRDTVHGPFDGTITVDPATNTIIANGTVIQVIYANDPAAIDYTSYGIQRRPAGRQHRPLARRRRPRPAPRLPRHRQGPAHRPRQRRPEEHRLRRQPRLDHQPGHHRVRRVLHHQRHHPGAEGDQRRVRHRPRPRRDRPLLHQRPEPDRQLPRRATAAAGPRR